MSSLFNMGNVKQLKQMEGDQCVPHRPLILQRYSQISLVFTSLLPTDKPSALSAFYCQTVSRQLEQEESWKPFCYVSLHFSLDNSLDMPVVR